MARDRTAGELKEALGAEVRRLRKEQGLTQQQLAIVTKYSSSRGLLSAVENGRELPSEARAAALDSALCAGGRLKRLRAQAWAQEKVERIGPALGPAGGQETAGGQAGETQGVSPTNRRDLMLRGVTVPFVAEALDRAEQASRAIAAGRPDPWTLAELAEDSTRVAEVYWSTPLDRLLPEVIARWEQCADMLEESLIGKTCEHVIQLAGQYAYYAARIGGHTGDRRLASGLGTLAEQYAETSRDPLLIGSVACLRSTVAFDAARYGEAADIAGQATGHAHPYTRARLFGYRARALAAGGHPDAARDALADMRQNMVDLPPMPGPALFDEVIEALYSAMTLAYTGDRNAEAFAREAIAGIPIDEYPHVHGLAWVTVGKAHAGSDPGTAADAGMHALEVNRSWPSVDVERLARQLHRTLAREHGQVAEVAQLGEAVRALRPAVDA